MPPPKQIDRYEIRDTLGTGAMGSVYLGWDPKLHREVALKVLQPRMADKAKYRKRFHREVRAVAALRHPNIVEIYDYSGEDAEQLFLVMEKLEGNDLFDVIYEHGIMPEPIAAAVGHELCSALIIAHQGGVIHRDLKPENVFVDAAGRVVLTDFGIVKAVAENAAVTGYDQKTEVVGTPGFMSPEVMMNKNLSGQADVYSMGVLLYNIATGKIPFEQKGPVDVFNAMVAEKYPDPRTTHPELSEKFCEIIKSSLRAKPNKRTAGIEVMRSALKEVLAAHGVTDLRDDLRAYMSDLEGYKVMAKKRVVNLTLQRLKVAIKDKDLVSIGIHHKQLNKIDPDVASDAMELSGVHNRDDIVARHNKQAKRRKKAGAFGGKMRLLGLTVVLLACLGAGVILSGSAHFLSFDLPFLENLYSDADLNVSAINVAKQKKTKSKNASPSAAAVALSLVPPVPPVPPAAATPTKAATTQETISAKTTKIKPAKTAKKKLKLAYVTVQLKKGKGILYVDGKRYTQRRNRNLELTPGRHLIDLRVKNKRIKKRLRLRSGDKILLVADLRKRRFIIKKF